MVDVATISPSRFSIWMSSFRNRRKACRVISERLAKPLSVIVASTCSRSASGIDKLIIVNSIPR